MTTKINTSWTLAERADLAAPSRTAKESAAAVNQKSETTELARKGKEVAATAAAGEESRQMGAEAEAWAEEEARLKKEAEEKEQSLQRQAKMPGKQGSSARGTIQRRGTAAPPAKPKTAAIPANRRKEATAAPAAPKKVAPKKK